MPATVSTTKSPRIGLGGDIPFGTRAAADELIAAGAPKPQADALARLLLRLTKLDIAVTRVI